MGAGGWAMGGGGWRMRADLIPLDQVKITHLLGLARDA